MDIDTNRQTFMEIGAQEVRYDESGEFDESKLCKIVNFSFTIGSLGLVLSVFGTLLLFFVVNLMLYYMINFT